MYVLKVGCKPYHIAGGIRPIARDPQWASLRCNITVRRHGIALWFYSKEALHPSLHNFLSSVSATMANSCYFLVPISGSSESPIDDYFIFHFINEGGVGDLINIITFIITTSRYEPVGTRGVMG